MMGMNLNEIKTLDIKRGEIRMTYFTGEEGTSKQKGWRPAIMVGNEKGIEHMSLVNCIPLTTKLKKIHQPTHVVLTSGNLKKESMALVESKELVDKRNIGYKIGELSEDDMCNIDMAIWVSEGLFENINFIKFIVNNNKHLVNA